MIHTADPELNEDVLIEVVREETEKQHAPGRTEPSFHTHGEQRALERLRTAAGLRQAQARPPGDHAVQLTATEQRQRRQALVHGGFRQMLGDKLQILGFGARAARLQEQQRGSSQEINQRQTTNHMQLRPALFEFSTSLAPQPARKCLAIPQVEADGRFGMS